MHGYVEAALGNPTKRDGLLARADAVLKTSYVRILEAGADPRYLEKLPPHLQD
jgi:hypothetical protein